MIKLGDKIKFTVKSQNELPTLPPQVGLIYPFVEQTYEGTVEQFGDHLGVSIDEQFWIGIEAMKDVETFSK